MAEPSISKQADMWVITVTRDNGQVQEYRCATEAQARALVLVLAPPRAEKLKS